MRRWPDRTRRALTGQRESRRAGGEFAGKPDLVLVMTDQQRFDQFGLTSDGLFETPHIDRLAAGGVTFDQAYSGGTNCVPARVSLLTGLQHHRVPKQPGSWTAMREGYWTIARELRRAGYATALVGKMHATPIRAQHGFDDLRLCEHLGYLAVSGGMDPDDVDDYHHWLVGLGLADWRDDTPAQWRSKVGRWFPYDADVHPTAWVERQALSVLSDRDPRRPLFLVVSFPHPHAPLNPPEPYASKYDPSDMTLPNDDFAVNEHLPGPFLEAMNATRKGRTPQRVGSTRENLAGTLTRTRSLIAQIDDSVGRILEKIDLTRTLVTFTSDHGDYAGHRGLLQKNPSIPFDDLARVPFIVAGLDSKPGRRASALVQSFDFVPTCLDYAGVDMSADLLDSRSLRPLLLGSTAADDVERTVMCPTLGWPMLRRGPYKYILHRASDTSALFDLASDPGETTDLSARNQFASVSAELRGTLDANLTRGMAELETVH
jgi:arylsulfatase